MKLEDFLFPSSGIRFVFPLELSSHSISNERCPLNKKLSPGEGNSCTHVRKGPSSIFCCRTSEKFMLKKQFRTRNAVFYATHSSLPFAW